MNDFILGVDLGQAQDYTALTVLERSEASTDRMTQDAAKTIARNLYGDGAVRPYFKPVTENHYQAQYLERLAIGTPYPKP